MSLAGTRTACAGLLGETEQALCRGGAIGALLRRRRALALKPARGWQDVVAGVG